MVVKCWDGSCLDWLYTGCIRSLLPVGDGVRVQERVLLRQNKCKEDDNYEVDEVDEVDEKCEVKKRN